MDGRPALSARQFTNLSASGALSSSSPALPSSLEQISVEKEVLDDPQPLYLNPFSSNSGLVGHMFSSSPSYSTDLQFSSAPRDKDACTSQYTTTTSTRKGSSLPLSHSTNSDFFQFAAASHGTEGNISFSWCSGSTSDIQDFPTQTTAQNSQLHSCNGGMGGALLQEAFVHRNDWRDWADKLSIEDEAWSSSLNDLLVDVSFADPEPKMSNQVSKQPANCASQKNQCQQQLSVSSSQVNAVVSPSTSSAAPPIKQRMRWTPELHDTFLEAVNKLGGSERAAPKGLLKLMKVEGLTIYHVKSHLQKYRTARYTPESTEGSLEKKSSPFPDLLTLDFKGGMDITEALRLQMQVQKQLHEQLETQRNLQLQIEEQGKYLQTMFEKQCKSGIDRLKATSKLEDEPSSNTPDALQSSPSKNDQETSPGQDERTGDKEHRHGTTATKSTAQKLVQDKRTPFTATDRDQRPRKDDPSDIQPSKRAKGDNPAFTSSEQSRD